MATLSAAPGIVSGIDPGTDMPRGSVICTSCDVSWNPMAARECWLCGKPGASTAAVLASAEETVGRRDLTRDGPEGDDC